MERLRFRLSETLGEMVKIFCILWRSILQNHSTLRLS